MSETTQTERDGSRHTAEMSEAQQVGMATTGEFMLRLLNDADRLARVERQAFFRDELEAQGIEVPEGVIAWEKSGPVARNPGTRKWLGTSGRMMYTAVDLLPDEPGPCWRTILD